MERNRFVYILMFPLLMVFVSCNDSGGPGLSDFRFIIFFILFVIIILSVAGSFRNGGKK